MPDHRVRLSDEDLDLIVAALRARAAMARGLRLHRVERLASRLADLAPGNPQWRIDADEQLREDRLTAKLT